jgi:hypothetical protein
VWLAEAPPGADTVELTAEIQDRLVGVGEVPPCVEVFSAGDEFTPYHFAALAASKRVWTDPDHPAPRPVRAVDSLDDARGPALTGADRDRVLAYLGSADILLEAPVLLEDVLEPGSRTVPLRYRSDGTWVWPETVLHQFDRHTIPPDPELVRHVLALPAPAPLGRLAGELAWIAITGQDPLAL